MEYVDLLDNEGNLTGQTVSRDEAHARGLNHRIVHIWIINDQKEVLLQKRAATKHTYPNTWAMSCEGHISAGQSSLDGAVRELREELGLTIAPEKIKLLMTFSRTAKYNDGVIYRHLIDVYLIRQNINLKDITIQKEELTDVKWMPLQEYLKLAQDPATSYRDYPEENDALVQAVK